MDWKGMQASSRIMIMMIKKKRMKVSEGVVEEGGRCCSLFLPSSIGSCCLLVAWLLGVSLVSRVSCVRAPYLHLFGLSSLELGSSLCRCEREGLNWKRWETMFLIVMLESSSRSAPRNEAMLKARSPSLKAWCSTIIEASCSSPTPTIIECKYSRVMMAARSCRSSARKATNQASSCVRMALRSITIMIASSSSIAPIIEYNHGH